MPQANPSAPDLSEVLIRASRRLSEAVDRIKFAAPVSHVYNPLRYARAPHESYLRAFGSRPKRVIFLGMNPGPFGMAQTGIPFGEIAAVRDWLGIEGKVLKPTPEHPKRIVTGFACERSEVSGKRLWGLFADRFGSAEKFFQDHFVLNYCPLAFLEDTGRNRTPDKLRPREKKLLFAACDDHLRSAVAALQPEWVIAVGGFAAGRVAEALKAGPQVGQILHPSPANPSANRDWAKIVSGQLKALHVWG